MKIAAIFLILLFPAALFCKAQDGKKKTPRPNILILVIDDASWNLSPPNTPSYVHLPGFDSIRLNGATVKSTFCTYSLCNPSRSSFLTSLYPHQNGAVDNTTPPNPEFKFFTQSLHNAGYHVAVCGKLTNTIYTYQDWTDSNRWMATKKDDYINPTVYFTNGRGVKLEGYTISIVGDTSNKWLAAIDTPFCFWEGVIVPHTPATPLPWTQGLFKNDYKPLTDFFPFTKDYPSFTYSDTFKYYQPGDSASVQQLIEQNYECYVDLDSTITIQLNTLKARGLLDNTFVLLINDNGYENGEHLLKAKNRPYQESLGLPCYIRYKPWFTPNSVFNSFMFTGLDVGPTILDAARVKDKAYEKQQMGSSIRKLETEGIADSILYYENIQLEGKNIHTIDPPSHRGVRTFNFNYVKYHCDSLTEELFDLRKDPGETQNVVREATYGNVLKRFRHLLDSMSQATFDTISSDTFYQPCKLISTAISPRLLAGVPNDFFSVSPNPANSLLSIRLNDENKEGEQAVVTIYNSIGEAVFRPGALTAESNQINLDIRHLPGGIYFLRLNAGGKGYVQPFIIQHTE